MSVSGNPREHLWFSFQVLALTLSCVLVGLGLVFAQWSSVLLPWIYVLDLFLWFGLWQARSAAPRSSVLLAVLTAPWEFLIYIEPAVQGALPLIWLGRFFRVFQLNLILLQQERRVLDGSGVFKLTRLVFNIALTSHLIACGWLLLGYVNEENSWLSALVSSGIADSSLYIRSLYWTITTMTTVGYGDITPGLDGEFLYAGFVMLVGASFYAYVIGNLASVIGQLNAQKAAHHERVQQVTSYLYGQQVPDALIERVKAYYASRWDRYRHFDEQAALADLPGGLAIEVKAQLAKNLIARVPIFQTVSLPIRDQLLAALRLEFVDPGSIINREGQKSQRIVFVVDGELSVDVEGEEVGRLLSGDYFGNHSMILDEHTTATVVAESYAELMYLEKQDYERIKLQYPEFVEMMGTAMSKNSKQMSEWLMQGIVL